MKDSTLVATSVIVVGLGLAALIDRSDRHSRQAAIVSHRDMRRSQLQQLPSVAFPTYTVPPLPPMPQRDYQQEAQLRNLESIQSQMFFQQQMDELRQHKNDCFGCNFH